MNFNIYILTTSKFVVHKIVNFGAIIPHLTYEKSDIVKVQNEESQCSQFYIPILKNLLLIFTFFHFAPTIER